MKKDSRHAPLRTHEQPSTTVIHNPEEDETILARWLRRALEKGPGFWGPIGGVVAVALLLALVVGFLTSGRSTTSDAWMEILLARTPSEQAEVAREVPPNSPAAAWAKHQAASGFFNQGVNDLLTSRDAALPMLKRALDLFREVAEESPPGSPQARLAALGVARTLEARNELDQALEQYRRVAEAWPGTPEAEEAARLAALLEQPEARQFYEQLFAYEPSATLPPGARMELPPGLPPGHPLLDSPTMPGPPLTAPTLDLPDVFAPDAAAAPVPLPESLDPAEESLLPTPPPAGDLELPEPPFTTDPPDDAPRP